MADAGQLEAVVRGIRACFNRLKAAADALHADLGITAAMRGVLETVCEEGDRPVPRIARAKGVSRQHIQVNVDALAAAGLVALSDNPAHRRSALVGATEKGRAAFAEMRRREARLLEELAAGLPAEDLARAAGVLDALAGRLQTGAGASPSP